ncbi:acetyl-CoA carboxylase biotin carboxyl carrier protein [Falsiroseomonas stagni]|uniref:Biotin carboxyl carrier protein of acetyl-CoA carboxylase n=1 Tax=Falsiroseomonas stagni DSM 19981 TaxID=1123062 RepID=A0A1I4DF89_9PROT|nr:acetyl-CoA carboxylase biotin carboxyl carrier protein [Falsiroseomonas stagni]SFK91430.1 acetyl-CoA carboxylase biotin carboxyl carrier protein [Falsiroseomonas stagni DSM 19981]
MSGVQFDPAAIRELAKILRETDLTEIELVEKDSRIRVARQITVQQVATVAAGPAAAPAAAAAAPVAAPPAPVSDAAHPGAVTSPMVGVAYLAPEPGAAPFITVGGRVAQGQTVLLIEAMKTFNQIRAPRAGVVTRILIESGSPVEYGEPMLIIE